MAVRVSVNQAEIRRLVNTDGRQYVLDTGRAVLAFARASAPRRTGALASSGHIRDLDTRGLAAHVTVAFSAAYALYVHEGTGLHGPRRRLITPRRARVLRWVSGGEVVFSRWSRGMRPRPWLVRALRDVCEPLGFTIRDTRTF